MNKQLAFEEALSKLKATMRYLNTENDIKKITESKESVLGRFQPIFKEEHLPQLTEEEFCPLLYFENNQHWSGLHRHIPKIRANMPLLRKMLMNLLNESASMEKRFNDAVETVPGMGKAIVTAILQIVFPDKYGVWNNTSEGGLRALKIWPEFDRGESIGSRYIKINHILRDLSKELGIDLWTLDALWWGLKSQDEVAKDAECQSVVNPPVARIYNSMGFKLESHLQEFIADNWERISLSQEWMIYPEQGDDDAGVEYPCDAGWIDILARHKNGKEWLIIELKRNQANDDTIGQVLRYMGWVKEIKAAPEEKVKGLIIAREANQKLLYALNIAKDVDLQLYELDFRLRQAHEVVDRR